MKIEIKGIDGIQQAAKEFVAAMGDNLHYAFEAPMGVGKTTFISALARELGSLDEASSPTFSIVNEYAVEGGKPIYHFDFYRIQSEAELIDMGVDDYWDCGSICLIEWPDMADPYLPEDLITVTLTENEDGSRTLEF